MSSTLEQLQDAVREPIDFQEETFLDVVELNRIINKAIRMAGDSINALYEDYYLTPPTDFAVTADTQDYDLPSDIYANKIRFVYYDDGNTKYPIKLLKDYSKIPNINSQDEYQYILTNDSTNGTKIKFYPNIRETAADHIKIMYIRTPKVLVNLTDVCDVPFEDFVIQYSIVQCLKKDVGNPMLLFEKEELKEVKALMIESLSNRTIQDDDHEIETDSDIVDYLEGCSQDGSLY